MPKPILPLAQMVPTRETCARLLRADFPRATRYAWFYDERDGWIVDRAHWPTDDDALPAPLAAEIGTVLHEAVLEKPERRGRLMARITHAWRRGGSEAEARALLWLRLDERDLLPDSE